MRHFASIDPVAVPRHFEVWLYPESKRNGENEMFNYKTEYALNKKEPMAIVYQDAYGNFIRLTETDFKSMEEFQYWKTLLDDSSHEEEKAEHIHWNHTISSTGFEEYLETIPAPDGQELEQGTVLAQIKGVLTQTQFRRLWMYAVDGQTLAHIAKHEGAAILSVYESIEGAKKKILSFFAKHPKKSP